MCTGLEIAAVVSLVAGAAGTAQAASAQNKQGTAAAKAGAYEAGISQRNAELLKEQARDKAVVILDNARRVRSTQIAQQGQSGAMVGVGSTEKILEDTDELARRDALVTLYEGIDGAVTQQERGRIVLASGSAAASSARAAGRASLISGIGNIAGQYTTYKALKTPRTSA